MRVISDSKSLIDNLYTNVPQFGNICKSGILKTDFSDHYSIFIYYKKDVYVHKCSFTEKLNLISINVFKLNVRLYLLCIHIDIFMHCALYVFYETNKDDYYKALKNRSGTSCSTLLTWK